MSDLELPTIIHPKKDPLRVRSTIDGTVHLRCEARGIPPPTVNIIFQGSALTSESSDPSVAMKALIVNEDSVGDYVCLAQNNIVEMPSGEIIPKTVAKHFLVELEGRRRSFLVVWDMCSCCFTVYALQNQLDH